MLIPSFECNLPQLLTSANVHDMVEGISTLNNVHHQLGEAQVVLGEQGVDGNWLDHVVHQEKPLGILQAALRQVLPGAAFLQGATLIIQEGMISVWM